MLQFIHILLLLVCIWQCSIAIKSLTYNFLRLLVFAGIGLIHGLVPAIAPFSIVNLTLDERIVSACYALCGTFALALGWMLFEHRTKHQSKPPGAGRILRQVHLQGRLNILFWVSATVGAIAWPLYIDAIGSSFTEYAAESRFAFRGGGNRMLAWVLSGLMNLAIIPGFLGFFLTKRHRSVGIIYAIVYALLFFLVTSGTRSFSMGIIGSLLCGYVLHKAQSVSRLLTMGSCGSVLIVLAVGLLPLRWQMAELSLLEMGEILISYDTYEDMLVRDPLNYHEYLVEVMSYFPEHHDFVDAASYRRILFFFLPHSQFPNLKPKDPNRIVAEVLFNADPDVDWMHPPSIFGDVYINFYGWYGIAVLAMQGFLLAWIARKMNTELIWLLLLGPNAIYFTFIGLRGQPYTLAIYVITIVFYNACMIKLLGLPLIGAQHAPRRRRQRIGRSARTITSSDLDSSRRPAFRSTVRQGRAIR